MIAPAHAPISARALGNTPRETSPLKRRLAGALGGLVRRLGYDATEPKNRRAAPISRLAAEDYELQQNRRAQLQSVARDIRRNFAIAAWAVRKHLDYVSTFTFEAKSGIPGVDERIEILMERWSKADQCDVARRHSLGRLVRLLEAGRTVDGDAFLLKLADGRLQAIESDRVRSVSLPPELGVDPARLVQGVYLDPAGGPIGYVVATRSRLLGPMFLYERLVPASHLIQHGYWDRLDQFRGISPLAPAINTFRDVYEGCDYALAKAKVAQMFGLVFYRDADIAAGPITPETDANGESTGTYNVDMGRGPVLLDLLPGDRAEFLEAKTPPAEFQQFCSVMISMALKALDIPYSFYDEAHTNFSGSRQALLQYDLSCNAKRADLRAVLDEITAWRLTLWVLDGTLRLPRGIGIRDLAWRWNDAGIPWIDPLKEVSADIAAIGAGIASRQEVCRRRGTEWFDVADQLAAEQAYLSSKGVVLAPPPGSPNPNPSPNAEADHAGN